MLTPKLQPECSSGLSHWQGKKLKRLRADALEKRNMAWVPKRSLQGKSTVPAPAAKPPKTKKLAETKDKRKTDRSRQDPGHSYSSIVPAPAIKPAGTKEDTRRVGRRSWQFSYHYERFQNPCHPCSSLIPSKPPFKDLSPAKTSELFRLFMLW